MKIFLLPMSSRDQTPLIGHLCPFSSPCSITISQGMRIVWNCDGSANLRWLFNGVLEKLRYQPASNRRGILRANDAVSVINDFRWIVEMAYVKSDRDLTEWVCLLEQIQTTSSASSEKIAWSRNIFVLLGMRQFG